MYAGPLEQIDWASIWDRQWRLKPGKGDSVEYWDRMAKHLETAMKENSHDEYINQLLRRIDLSPEMSVLDVGCGTGALTLPLARRVRKVTALDLSPAMLDYLSQNAAAEGLRNIAPLNKNWQQARIGVDIERHDLVLASRSLPMGDLRQCLIQMDRAARRACYLTWPAGENEYAATVAATIGREYHPSPSYVIILNLLYTMNILAEVELFEVHTTRWFTDMEEALSDASHDQELDASTERRLRTLFQQRLQPRGDRLCWEMVSRWALISWRKADAESRNMS